ncbi:MAG: DUF87 domain-containing protein [Clostridia bacterium]|nr:DUF87 domain-containing protein [Clostridia bacterium]
MPTKKTAKKTSGKTSAKKTGGKKSAARAANSKQKTRAVAAAAKQRPEPVSAPERSEAEAAETRRMAGTFFRYGLGIFAVFLIITFFEGIDSGFLGGIRDVLKGLFGFGYYLFPFFLLLVVFTWGKQQTAMSAAAKFFLAIADFLCILFLVHLISVSAGLKAGQIYNEVVKETGSGLYQTGIELHSGGIVGGTLCALLCRGVGPVATSILAVVGIFICTVLLCGSTPMATLRAVVRFFRNLTLDAAKGEDEEPDPDEGSEVVTKQQLEQDRKNRQADRQPVKKEPAEPGKKKHRMPSVLLDDDEAEAAEKGGKSDGRFLTAAEEQEEVFQPSDEWEELKFADEVQGTASVPAESAHTGKEKPEEKPAPAQDGGSADETKEPEKPDEESEEDESGASAPPRPYVFPSIDFLTADKGDSPKPTPSDVAAVSRKLEEVLDSFKVKAHVIGASFGPTVTRYEVQPETGVRVRQISNLSDDIALHLAATSIRIENIPGKSAIGIEVPNRSVSTVRLRNLIDNPTFQNSKSKLICALGEDVSGQPVYLDIGKMPHLLIAGATGQGKSVCINSMIVSLLYHARPDEVRMLMIDPKAVEMREYNGIPHLLVPVITDAKKAAGTLNWACVEMDRRYQLIQDVGAKNLADYNTIIKDDPERQPEPYIVIFIDELAELMMLAPDDVETSICRLAQKARASGIHLVIGTQRPSVDVITGLIKANIPSRIAFTVTSQVDSRTILDMVGAEKLLGRGDMLFSPIGSIKPIRVQGAFVDDKTELITIMEFIKQAAATTYDEKIISEIEQQAKLCGAGKKNRMGGEEPEGDEPKLDDKFFEAMELAIDSQNISTSMIQTRLGLGYARAARIVGIMEQKGFIGPFDSATKKRRIVITREELMELKLGKGPKPPED